MAENDSRVHSASEVHKRRAPKKVRSELDSETESSVQPAAKPTAEPAGAAEPAGQPAVNRDAGPVHHSADKPATDAGSGDSANPVGEEPAKRKRWGARIAVAAACVVAAGLLVFAGFAAGSRWLRYNDAHDMQGTWYVDGTDVPLKFTDSSIEFNASTSYAYEIDQTEKTITYSLGGLEGHGRYWFSDDRSTLVITDGEGYTMWSTLFDDFGYGVSCFFGNEELPVGEGSIVLTHVITLSDKTQADKAQAEGSGEAAEPVGDGAEDSVAAQTGSSDEFSGLTISDVLVKEGGEADEEEEWS